MWILRKRTLWSSVALRTVIGTLTSPNEIAPLKMLAGMAHLRGPEHYQPRSPVTARHEHGQALAAGLRVGVLMEVQEEPQPHAGLVRLPGRTVRRRDGAPRGEQLLDREGGLVIGGRDLHHSQARHGHMRVIDLPHAWHYALAPAEVLRSRRLHSTG